jgi:hypothetical protein
LGREEIGCGGISYDVWEEDAEHGGRDGDEDGQEFNG